MKRYLLFANQLYCYPILRPLQEAIKKRGGEIAWYLHKTKDLLTTDDALRLRSVQEVKRFNPDVVYVTTDWVPDFFPGIKVEVFHGFDIGKRADTRQSHFRIRGYFDLYCTQGSNTTEPFQKLAKQYGYFKAVETGWPKLDPMFNYPTPSALRSKIGTHKPIILYSSTFSKSFTSAPLLANTIRHLASLNHWHWIVTLHPKMSEEIVNIYKSMASENLTFVECGQDIIPLLHAADAMLCDTSSIFLEYLLLNKPVVTFNTAMPGPHLINIHNENEIENALQHALSRPTELMQRIEEYNDQLHPYRDGKSSERVLEATDNFIDQDYGKLKPRSLNIVRKFQARKKFKYYHLK